MSSRLYIIPHKLKEKVMRNKISFGAVMAICIGIGTAIGAATGAVAPGVTLGVGLGAVFGAMSRKKRAV